MKTNQERFEGKRAERRRNGAIAMAHEMCENIESLRLDGNHAAIGSQFVTVSVEHVTLKEVAQEDFVL